MKPRQKVILLATSGALAVLALSAIRAREVPKVATGFVARVMCSEIFVSGFDPSRTFAETTDAISGGRLITWAMDYQVDRTARDVTVTLFGLGRSRAVYRDGLGCTLDHGKKLVDVSVPAGRALPALLPEIASAAIVTAQNPDLAAALDRAFRRAGGSSHPDTRGRSLSSRMAA